MKRLARSARSAWVLLEVVLALSIFTMAAMGVLSVMGQASRDVQTAALELQSLDLARSALAQMEAGLKQPDELMGPVPVWSESDTDPDALAAFEDDLPEPSGWELEIQTEPSEFVGLTLVTVTARRVDPATGEFSFATTLHQLIRLSAQGEDSVGERDDLSREAERGARSRSGGGSTP